MNSARRPSIARPRGVLGGTSALSAVLSLMTLAATPAMTTAATPRTYYVVEVPPGLSDGTLTATLDVLARSFAAVPVVGARLDATPGITAGVLSIKELKTLLELMSGGSTWSLAIGLGAGAALAKPHHWACH